VRPVLDGIRSAVEENHLPFATEKQGIRYFTFGGATLNRVILGFFDTTGKPDDLSILVPRPLDLAHLPVACLELAHAAERAFVASTQQTMFQQFLPLEFQRREWLEAWLKDRDAEETLRRIVSSRTQPVRLQLFSPFLS
jgi:hypothetical protein